jgi:hypothetical protein
LWLLQVHDSLVEQGVDPASDAYYAAIEEQVAAAFPDKWAQHLAILAALGEPSLAVGYTEALQFQRRNFERGSWPHWQLKMTQIAFKACCLVVASCKALSM